MEAEQNTLAPDQKTSSGKVTRQVNRGHLPKHLPRVEEVLEVEDTLCTYGSEMQVPAPDRLIPGGLPTEATVAHVLVSKYGDHTPLYRQARIFERQGIALDRSTLADWVGRAAFELAPGGFA